MNKFKTLALVLGLCIGVVVATSSSATALEVSGTTAHVDIDGGSSKSKKSKKTKKSSKKTKSSSKSGSKSSSGKSNKSLNSSKSSKSSKVQDPCCAGGLLSLTVWSSATGNVTFTNGGLKLAPNNFDVSGNGDIIHISCSQPIYEDQVIPGPGGYKVVGFTDLAGSVTPGCGDTITGGGCVNIKLTFTFDFFPCDVSYLLLDVTAGTILDLQSAGDLCMHVEETVVTYSSCVAPDHCYLLSVEDVFCDGICCIFGNGTYELCLGDVNPSCISSPSAGDYGCAEIIQVGACGDLQGNNDQKDLSTDVTGMNIAAYPNPIKDIAKFDFSLATEDRAVVSIIDVNGSVVSTIFDAVVGANEVNSVSYDASELSSGIYFVNLSSSTDIKREKLMVVK